MSESATGILWLDIIILLFMPILIGPFFLFIKAMWDRYNVYKREKYLMKYNKTVEKYSQQLKEFYWPMYVYLLKEYVLWSTIKSNKEYYEDSFSETDSDYGIDRELYKLCDYCDVETGKKCRNIVPIQCTGINGSRCIYHLNKNNVIKPVFKEFVIKNSKSNNMELSVVDLEKGTETLEDIYNNCLNQEKTTNNFNISEKIISAMHDKLLINHRKIVEIIEKNIFVAEPDKTMRRLLMKYIQYANMLSIVMETDEDVEKLKDLGVRYPRKLLPIIERKVNLIQEKYNEITDIYFEKLGKF